MLEDKNNHDRSEIGDTGVSFEDEWRQSSQISYSKTPKMNQWIINHSGGLIKDGRQANFVLLGVAAVAAVIAFYLSFGGGLGASDNKVARDQMLKIHPELIKQFKQ